ncbi:MAG: flagellar assembly protein [Candidatus Brocadiaceae bacterium]|nr:flagellar assembly protein [Candidatus Brocadiaceae bacterium]
MKNKKIYAAPEVRGVHVLQSRVHRIDLAQEESLQQELLKKEEDERLKELESAKDEAYKKGRADAEQASQEEFERLKKEYASLVDLFQDAARQMAAEKEKIWRESELEILKLALAIAKKTVGYEISENSVNIMKQAVTEALTYVGEKKLVAVRVSPEDLKKMNTLEGMKIVGEGIKVLEDRNVAPGGCVVETDFGNVESHVESRWEEIRKALVGNMNEPTAH